MRKRLFAVGLVLLLVCVATALAYAEQAGPPPAKSPDAVAAPAPLLRVIVHFENADLAGVAKRDLLACLKEKAAASQGPLLAYLAKERERGTVGEVTPLFIVNAVAVEATPGVVVAMGRMPGVVRVSENKVIQMPPPMPAERLPAVNAAEWNIDKVRAPEAWAAGITGAGVVVGAIDTGVDYTHPDVDTQWRGYPADPVGNWLDVVNGQPMPYDDHGHGTHITGTIMGGNAGGTDIGVAPGAQWIHAKAFNAGGGGYLADILVAMQWMLDPDGDGDPSDAPGIVSNSWGTGPGMYEDLRPAVQAWRAANIFPSFASGNCGCPSKCYCYCGQTGAPGNYPESFSVGATDSADVIAYWSSYGPSPYDLEPPDGNLDLKPDVSAPGVSVRSSLPGNSYGSWSGTSMACPHVSGLAALLRQAAPGSSVDQLETWIREGTVDLGPPGPDFCHGVGRIDCKASVDLLGTPVSGTVTCTNDGWGVDAVTITAVQQGSGDTRTTSSNPDGTYTIYLADGTWDLSAAKAGWNAFSPASREVTVPPEATGQDFSSTPTALGGLSGTVTSVLRREVLVESPHPYANNMCVPYPVAGPAGATTMRLHFPAIEVEGYYDHVVVCDSLGTVVADYSGAYTDVWTPEFAGPNATVILYTDSSVTYWGFAIDMIEAAMGGAPGVLVSLSPGGASALTGPDGSYGIGNLCPHTYTATPSKAGVDEFIPPTRAAAVEPGATTPGVDFVALSIEHTISGQVMRYDNTPMAGVTMLLTPVGGGARQRVATDVNGEYEFAAMAGDYVITPRKSGTAFLPPSRTVTVGPDSVGNDFLGVVLADNQAFIALTHTYPEALSVSIGVGDPRSPTWTKLVQPSYEGYVARSQSLADVPEEYAYWVVDIADGAAYLPPTTGNRWHAKAWDVDEFGDTGHLQHLVIRSGGSFYYVLDQNEPIFDNDFSAIFLPNTSTVPLYPWAEINGGAASTSTPLVDLRVWAGLAGEMRFYTAPGPWTPWEPYGRTKMGILLSPGDGVKTVSAQFRRWPGGGGVTASDTINLTVVVPAPTNLVATAPWPTQVNLTWTDTCNFEQGFKVYRKKAGGSWEVVTVPTPNLTHYEFTNCLPNTTYYFAVRAYYGSTTSPNSNLASVTTPPLDLRAPSNLVATAVSCNQINLTWVDNATNEQGFKVYRKKSGGSWESPVTLPTPNLNHYESTDCDPGTLYYFAVRAYCGTLTSPNSNLASATTPPCP